MCGSVQANVVTVNRQATDSVVHPWSERPSGQVSVKSAGVSPPSVAGQTRLTQGVITLGGGGDERVR